MVPKTVIAGCAVIFNNATIKTRLSNEAAIISAEASVIDIAINAFTKEKS